MNQLFDLEQRTKLNGPVECLGMTFSNEGERRKHFLSIMREKLKDPDFRKVEGFPIGSDEDILALSDPPYFTACPNPFIADFVKCYGKPYDSVTDNYRREPLASDTGSGKTHPIYTAHSYHSKIPHLAIMPCVLHYTEPGDIVLDGFSGSGMTGVAAQLCGQPEADFKENLEAEWRERGLQSPSWGGRRPILIDLSPVANFIAYNLNLEASSREFQKAADDFFKKIDAELGWMYETLHTDGKRKGRINYVVWSEVFTCPNCAGDVVFMDRTYNVKTGEFASEFECPDCGVTLTTRSCEHKFSNTYDIAIGETVRKISYVPVEIEYILQEDKTKYRKKPDANDLAMLSDLSNMQPRDWFPTAKLPIGEMRDSNHLAERGITHYHHFYLPRALHSLSTMWRIAGEWPDLRARGLLKFMVEQCSAGMTLMNGYEAIQFGRLGGSQVGRFMKGVYYIRPVVSETAPWYNLVGKYKRLLKMISVQQLPRSGQVTISTASSLQSPIPDKSVDYIYTDPPFGDAIKYGDLNLLIEAWHNLFSRLENEVLWDELKNKTLVVYSDLMRRAFNEYYRVLKPGRWMTVVFHNSKNSVWTTIQQAIGDAGFVVADVRTLDREQGSFNQVTAAGAVKQDLVISAYKPNGGLEDRFKLEAGTEDGVWDFIRTHLKQLPVFVSKDGQAEIIAERQNYLLFDRMIAFHVQRGVTIPLSATEFYAGLAQRFSERDGMYFLPDQVTEYDKKRLTVNEVLQLQLFVIDESSAIQWLKQQLTRKPQTFQELHPQFLKEIGGWQKQERALELSQLLDDNFICYDGKGEVPSQIHSYLSSNFKELRNLPKDNPELRTKGKDRWYIPDPNKAGDIEKKREKGLLKEFEEYWTSSQKRIKVFRLEAVRAGFKKAWQEHDYSTIITVARKIQEEVLQEDPKLLMWYDQALTRSGEV